MSFFRYPGGKAKLREPILKKIHELKAGKNWYVEPFWGGGGIGTHILDERLFDGVWINDIDTGVALLWRSVANHPVQLKQMVTDFKPTVQAFLDFQELLLHPKDYPVTESDRVLVGFMKLAVHQLSYSGLGVMSGGPLGGMKQKSKYKIDCRWSPKYICQKIDHYHERLRRCVCTMVTSLDFDNLFDQISSDAVVYLDPPYFQKGPVLYQHSFNTLDHIRLAFLLKKVPFRWVLSYDDCPEIRELYSWATIETISANYSITALKKGKKRLSRTKQELLITGPK